LDFLAPALFVGVLFILLRQIERWLHQHIFKVGWLLTHNYETTTILYYTIFLPGVLLHEVLYWLMAGVLNVRADRSIRWPEKQEIGNLQLNFIKLSPKANLLKKAIIAATPLIVGLLAIWLIAINIFELEVVMAIAASGRLEDISNAITILTSTTDFWLWFYISFTIANTMFPTISKDMRGWWQIGGTFAVILISLLILNIGQSFLSELTLTLGQFLNSLSLTLMLTITINITMVILLGAIESTIERITGHSATFQKGKMITMTREEVLKLKLEKQEKRLTTRSAPRRKTALSNPASIYALELPIPGPPGQEPITTGVAAVLGMELSGALPDTREEDNIVETTATDSTRQRMLKLFSDGDNDNSPTELDAKSVAGSIPALPSSKSIPPTEDFEDIKAKPKPEFDVQDFSKPETSIKNKPKSPQPDNDASIKQATAKLDTGQSDRKIDKESKEDTSILQTNQTAVPSTQPSKDRRKLGDIPKDADRTKDDIKTPSTPARQSKSNLSPTTPDKIDASDDDEQLATRLPRRTSVFDDIAKSTPSTPDKADDNDDHGEQLSTHPLRTSIFDDIAKPTSPALGKDTINTPDTPTQLTGQFSRPFVKRDELDTDQNEDTDDASLTVETSQFQRPFAPPEKSDDDEKITTPPQSTSWRSQFSSTPTTNFTDEDEEEEGEDEDEQLSTRLPQRSSLFNSLNTPSTDSDSKDKTKEPSPTTSPTWRSQLSSSSKTTDDNKDAESDEDEQLPRTGSLLKGLGRPQPQQPKSTIRGSGSRPAPKPTSKQPVNDWRSQLISDDEDEGEELNYEPIEDEIIYEDEDDYYDGNDD
jgi:hypothetical protein